MAPGKLKVENPGIKEIFTKFYCNYCQDELNGLRVSCAVCKDFDLCPECFSCGAEIGSHKNNHKYYFSNNGNFSIFPKSPTQEDRGRRRTSIVPSEQYEGEEWNVREDHLLLDAVEMYGYGNWKDIARHVESKNESQVKERYIKRFINGAIGTYTWREDLRGNATDHTIIEPQDRGPLSPSLTGKLPGINIAPQEALLLGYMPHRDDFEEFDKSVEGLVSQIGVKSLEDEDIDTAIQLVHVDMYERLLREAVRRKRVARDFQLVSKYFKENPLIPFGVKISPLKMASMLKMKKTQDPKRELMDALKPFCQFNTCQEFKSLHDNLCYEKDLKVRIAELKRYRESGLMKVEHLVPYEKERYKREVRIKARKKRNGNGVGSVNPARLLPKSGDYSLKAMCSNKDTSGPSGVALKRGKNGAMSTGKKRKGKSGVWSRKKLKTGRRLLLQMGCTLTAPPSDPETD